MNPTTGTFITQDTYQGTIFDPTSLHKYLYANANPVMNVDPSGYSAKNDISFYQQFNASKFNNGSNISDAFNNSKQTHQAWIDIWGSESNYVEAHGMFGIEMSREFGMDRTLISAITDIEVAKYFGNTIYEIKVPRANVLFQTIEGVGEKEVLIRICADKIKKLLDVVF